MGAGQESRCFKFRVMPQPLQVVAYAPPLLCFCCDLLAVSLLDVEGGDPPAVPNRFARQIATPNAKIR